MAITNHERVGKALDFLRDGLRPFIERELKSQYQQRWLDEVKTVLSPQQLSFAGTADDPQWDIARVLAIMWNRWNEVFRKTLGQTDRTLVSEHARVVTGGLINSLSAPTMRIAVWIVLHDCSPLCPRRKPRKSKR